MKKTDLLVALKNQKIVADDNELNEITKLKVLDLLLDYINDPHIREAVDEIPF